MKFGKVKFLLSLSFAIFSMFFGAGNIVFPLRIGYEVGAKLPYGFLGLSITAVILPLLGLLILLRYEGDYYKFFYKIGKIPGYAVIVLLIALIGPFGGIPRCMSISHATVTSSQFCPSFLKNIDLFGLISCVLIFLFSYRLNRVLKLLGSFLTPLLLFFLSFILVKGLWFSDPGSLEFGHTHFEAFGKGLLEGYQTMDLLAAFFFSSCVLLCLKKEKIDTSFSQGFFRSPIVWAGIVASLILGVIYLGFGKLALNYHSILNGIAPHQMLGTLTYHILGPYAGFTASMTMVLACLTTQIALAIIVAEFLFEKIVREKISYASCLMLTLFVSFFVAKLQFEGIVRMLSPLLHILYPSLILLIGLNFLSKQYAFKQVKLWFYSSVAISAACYWVISFVR